MDILIACPDPIMLGLLKHGLSDREISIYTTTSREGMIEVCKSRDFAIIITLFTHPFLSGDRVLLKIRPQGKIHPTIYLISWIQNEQTVLSLYENEVNQYFTLPINMTKLRKRVKERLFEIQI